MIITKNRVYLSVNARRLFYIMSAAMLVFFLKSPDAISESVKGALLVCAQKLVPSLFPFIVLVGILNLSGASEYAMHRLGKPMGKLLGITPSAVYAVILGAVGGFPIGAVCVRDLYESGKVGKKEAEKLLAISSNASPAFCVLAVGESMLGNRMLGIKLYICQLCTVLVIGMFLRGRADSRCFDSVTKPLPLSLAVSSAVERGGLTMVKICSFAVFFAAVGDAVCSYAERLFGYGAACIAAAVTELTLGTRYASSLEPRIGAAIIAFSVGWAGLSVYMQTASAVWGTGLSLSVYRRAKAVQGILMAVTIYALW